MTTTFVRCTVACALLSGLCVSAMQVHAQSTDAYPVKPVRFICPFPPGGLNDLLARYFAQHLTTALGQQVFVDNRGGAGGIIGAEAGARAPADGYTITMANLSILAINPFLYEKLPYDSLRDFQHVIAFAESVNLLLLHPSMPPRTAQALIEFARKRPGEINFASQGIGTPAHLALELFSSMAGIRMVHIPYKGAGGAIPAVIAGEAQVYFEPVATSLMHVRAGKLRAIAVTSGRRAAMVPELPTVAESGLPGFEVTTWYGLLVPAATPRPVVVRLNEALNRILTDAAVTDYLTKQALLPIGGTPEAFHKRIVGEQQRWSKVVKETGARAQ